MPRNKLRLLRLSRTVIAVFLGGLFLVFFALSGTSFASALKEVEQIEVLFSPEDNCGARILEVIEQAKQTIDVAMYSFTNRVLAQSLVLAHLQGVKVRVFMDGENRRQNFSKADYLIKKGIEVRFENGLGLMHNKFCVVDQSIVVTGSFNWTVYADLRNDENLVIIKSEQLAKIYQEKFEQLWQGKNIDQALYGDENRLEKILLR